MTSFFPSDPKKIRSRIRSYERKLQKEKELYGSYDDGYGKRFLLGPLYMLQGDLANALNYYQWYVEAFPDDSPEPYNHLTWSLALHRASHDNEAFHKLYQTMLANLYLIPHLIDMRPEKLEIWLGSNMKWLEYAQAIPLELLALWTGSEKAWAQDVYNNPRVVWKREQYVEIHRQLKYERPGPKRTQLCDEANELER